MKKINIIIVVAIAALTMQSCVNSSLGIRNQSHYLRLDAEDLEMSERMTAEASVTRILGIDWSRLFNKNYGDWGSGYAPIVGGSTIGNADQNKALFKLLKQNPEYDAIMYPRFERKKFRILFLFSVTDVKASARLAKIKNETPSAPEEK